MSFSTSFFRRSGFVDAPLWFPKVSASITLFARLSSLVLINGHFLPCVRMLSIQSQRGWRPKTERRMFGGRNSFPGPRGESRCALSMSSKLKSYFSNIAKLCFVASSKSSKMNSGAEGVLHDEAMTPLILLRRSLGQSNCVVLGAGSSETSWSSGLF